jgi:Superinfection immunity protein
MSIILAQASSDGGAAAGFALLILLAFLAGLYFLPTIIAFIWKPANIGVIVIINVLLGWTFVGWVVSLALAFTDRREPVQVNVIGPSAHD